MRSLLRLILVPAACLGLLATQLGLPFDRDAADFFIAVGLAALIAWLVLKEFGRQLDGQCNSNSKACARYRAARAGFPARAETTLA